MEFICKMASDKDDELFNLIEHLRERKRVGESISSVNDREFSIVFDSNNRFLLTCYSSGVDEHLRRKDKTFMIIFDGMVYDITLVLNIEGEILVWSEDVEIVKEILPEEAVEFFKGSLMCHRRRGAHDKYKIYDNFGTRFNF